MSKEKTKKDICSAYDIYKYTGRPWRGIDDTDPRNFSAANYEDFELHKGEFPTDNLYLYFIHPFGYSDYSGSLVDKANIKSIMEEAKPEDNILTMSGSYGSESIAIPLSCENESIWEMLANSQDYPLIDEDEHSNLEMEAQDSDWENCYERDFRNSVVAEWEEKYDIHDWSCKSDSRSESRMLEELNKLKEKALDTHMKYCGEGYNSDDPHKPECEQTQKEYYLHSDNLSLFRSKAAKYCNEHCTLLDNYMDSLPKGALRWWFEQLRERANVYWVNESGEGMYVDIKAVVNVITVKDFVELDSIRRQIEEKENANEVE